MIVKIILIIVALILLAWIISPIDPIPDVIPVIGWIDDLFAFICLIPVAWKIIKG